LDATLPYDGNYYTNNNFSDVTNKYFNPTVKIIGGHIFVGAGQTLGIDGGRFNYNGSFNEKGESLNGYNTDGSNKWITTRTLTVSPSSLTVEQGGIVNISKPTAYYVGTTNTYTASPYMNVTTDMSVNGKVNLTTGAWAGGNVVVGNNGEMTIADTARYDGNIYVEAGGTLTVGASTIVGNIQVRNGGKVTIGAGAVITGDVYCAGDLAITGKITINATEASAVDFSDTDIDESLPVGGPYKYHGIFIYDDPSVGTGTLTFPGAPTSAPVYTIEGNSGKIHTFVGYPDIDHDKAGNTFCNDCSDTNVCMHWTTSSDVWQAQSGEIPNE
jgi:cytoskeletal protein CcmA (bactofilin family)